MSKLVIKTKISKNKIVNKLFPLNEDIKSSEISVKKSCSIYRDKNTNKIYSDSTNIDSNKDLLFNININGQITTINFPQQKSVYLLLKGKIEEDLKKLYKINEGDLIKIGECYIKILLDTDELISSNEISIFRFYLKIISCKNIIIF